MYSDSTIPTDSEAILIRSLELLRLCHLWLAAEAQDRCRLHHGHGHAVCTPVHSKDIAKRLDIMR